MCMLTHCVHAIGESVGVWMINSAEAKSRALLIGLGHTVDGCAEIHCCLQLFGELSEVWDGFCNTLMGLYHLSAMTICFR